MATAKRKLCEEETDVEIEKNKTARMENRLGDLPEALQLRILACLDAKHAVEASLLSKTWVSNLWTRIPVLEFNCFRFDDFTLFHNFVKKVLLHRDDLAKLDGLNFNVDKMCSAEILKSVFEYAFSHGVKKLEASVQFLSGNGAGWPVSECDSLTNLKLQTSSCCLIRCPLLGPAGSIYFKNLTVLYLKGARITDVEPFSGFAVLKTLTLLDCHLSEEFETLRVHSLRLSDLTISRCSGRCELTTPRLRFLEYRGFNFPKHEGLDVLENLVMDFPEIIIIMQQREKQYFDELLLFFSTLGNLKWLTISLGIIFLLLRFVEELAKRNPPFWELKGLKLDIRDDHLPHLFFPRKWESIECVKAYLLKNSPHPNFTTTSTELI